MSSIKKLWTRFNSIEVELENCTPDTDAYKRKRNELLNIYNEIQDAENNLTVWETRGVAMG